MGRGTVEEAVETISPHLHGVQLSKKKTKLHGLSPRANYTTERPPLVGEVIVNFCG
jgi:hypothetical protein